MNLKELFEISKGNGGVVSSSPFALRYASWAPISKEELANLSFVGSVENQSASQTFVDEANYWSPSSPIVESLLPYSACLIYRAHESGEYFLIYDDYGGHKPEMRCRYFNPELFQDR